MLTIIVPAAEAYDRVNEVFAESEPAVTLTLEHSLVSLSKWESKYEKPFLTDKEKTDDEVIEYIKMMILSDNVSPDVVNRITKENQAQIREYIAAKMSATWFAERPMGPSSRTVITAEILYYWMFTFNVPMECQNWHLNRLLTLIRVCNEKNAPKKKISRREWASQQRALNEARRAQHGTTG